MKSSMRVADGMSNAGVSNQTRMENLAKNIKHYPEIEKSKKGRELQTTSLRTKCWMHFAHTWLPEIGRGVAFIAIV